MARQEDIHKEATALASETTRLNDKLASLRPFHETIVLEIRRCNPSPSEGDIFALLRQIRETKIPANHEAILAAILKYFDFPGATKYAREIRETMDMVLLQKQVALQRKHDE